MTVEKTDYALELRGVSKWYPNATTAAVEELNLGICRGEFVTFLEPCGSGKSTTGRFLKVVSECVAGPLPPVTPAPQPHLHTPATMLEIWGVARG